MLQKIYPNQPIRSKTHAGQKLWIFYFNNNDTL
jgi:hypothetical protein